MDIGKSDAADTARVRQPFNRVTIRGDEAALQAGQASLQKSTKADLPQLLAQCSGQCAADAKI